MVISAWVFEFEDGSVSIIEGQDINDALQTLNKDCHENIERVTRSKKLVRDALDEFLKE